MNVFCDSEIYKKTYVRALEANRDAIDQINEFKGELDAVRVNLRENRKRLLVDVIVPISRKAMIRAKLIHTNEIYVNLGDRWFLKTSCEKALEISERMIERCNENIRQWEREANLLNSNLKILDEVSVFPTETLKDIVEPYDAIYETSWKEQHIRREREHRKRELSNISTDEELFQRLDRLEVEETAIRTDCKVDSDGKIFGFGHVSSKNTTEVKFMDNVPLCYKKTEEIPRPGENLVRQKTEENLHGISVVYFKHSDKILKSSKRIENERIVSPKDVYSEFLHELRLKLETTTKPQHSIKTENKEKGCVIGDIVEKQSMDRC